MSRRPASGMTIAPIGGSEAAAACGVDPYRSRVNLWAEKTGLAEPREVGEAAEWGKILQPVIAAQVEQHGYLTMPAPDDAITNPRCPHAAGHLDGYCAQPPEHDDYISADSRGVLEIKTAGVWTARLWNEGEAPTAYVLQLQHYLALTDLNWGLLACLVGGQRLELRRIERDDQLIATMLDLEQEFYEMCVAGTPPLPDGSKATEEMLKRLYPRANEGEVVLFDADDYATVKRLRALKEARKEAERQEKEAQQALEMRLGSAELGVYEGRPVVRWQLIESTVKAKEEHTRTYRRFSLP